MPKKIRCPSPRLNWSSVTSGHLENDMHLEIPQLKSMGNTPFGRFSAIKPQTPSPVILSLWRSDLAMEKNPDLFPRPNFCSCKVRTHATQIWEMLLLSVSQKINHLTPTLLYLRSWGHPLPTCAKKIRVRRHGRIGRQ